MTLNYPRTEKWCHIGIPVDIIVGEKEHSPVTFVHPVTGSTHTFYPGESELLDARTVWSDAYRDIRQPSKDSDDLEIRALRSTWQRYEEKPYFATLLYEVIPPLPQGDRLDIVERDIINGDCGFCLLFNAQTEAGPHGQKQDCTMTVYHEKPFEEVSFIIAGLRREGLKEETFQFRV